MCGICGEVRLDGQPASERVVGHMVAALAPRGPDGEGLIREDRLAVGHRRLAVFDRSSRAAQPMVDQELGLGIVFGGAIYNHGELRDELCGKGYRFRTTSDTEVLLAAHHAWGERFVERLDGMFAFALWERGSGRVLLARDRLGIKPLYLARVAGALRFASSLPALLASGGVDTALDPVGLHYNLTFQGAIPGPRTLLRGARKVKPGTLVVVEPDGRVTHRVFWRLRFGPRPGDGRLSTEAWQERVDEGLRRAVHRRLRADVPLGIFLSGGLDSSLIAALAAAASPEPLPTFTIGSETSGDELSFASLVAARFGGKHHALRASPDKLVAAIPGAVAAMSEPIYKADAVAFYLLAQRASESVAVVLCGQGADELFAGYSWYPRVDASTAGLWTYVRQSFDRTHHDFLRAVAPAHHGQDWAGDRVAEHFSRDRATHALEKALRFDTTQLLPEDPLKRVDDMTMAWGVEGRVPFLCHRLVELAARLPPELKLASGGKHVLKAIAGPLLPARVIERPKAAFPVPALDHLEGPALEFVCDVLTSNTARQRGLFREGYLDDLLSKHPGHGTGPRLWQAAILEQWLATHL